MQPGYDQTRSVWGRMGERFGVVALRPRLGADVRVRRIEDEAELVQISSGRVLDLSQEELRVVRRFDGTATIAEIIGSEIRSGKPLQIQPVLALVDRVMRADMLDNFPPNFFHQLQRHIAKRAVEMMRVYHLPYDGDPGGGTAAAPSGVGASAAAGAAAAQGSGISATPQTGDSLRPTEQVPWRPRTPLLAERAKFLSEVELLQNLDSWSIGMLAEAAHEETFPAASNIVVEGDIADRFYIVRSGDVNVTRSDQGEDAGTAPRRIGKLEPGGWFGEVGLLEGARRNANVRVGPSRPAQVYSFEPEVFERFISPHIDSYRGRQLLVRRRAQLERIPLFAELERTDLETLAHAMREHHIPASTPVFHQGEEGDRFYLVMQGSVGIVKDGVPVAKLTAGDFFGETALLFTGGRTATVIAIDDTLLWSVDKASFQNMLRQHLLGRRDVMPTLINRLHS
jgi:CRP-like cAMP-binding protein